MYKQRVYGETTNGQLKLQNIGFFISPRGNTGQTWHTDIPSGEPDTIWDPSRLVTLIISLSDHKYVCLIFKHNLQKV